MLPTSPFNETHYARPRTTSACTTQANATTTSAGTRRQIVHEMQQIDFTEGGYIIPAFIDTLDAYSTKITGYRPRPGSASRWATSTSSTTPSSEEPHGQCQRAVRPRA